MLVILTNITLLYAISLLSITGAFLIYTFATRKPLGEILDFREFFKKWLQSHGQTQETPEETPGPLPPYQRVAYEFSVGFAKFGFTPNKMTIFNFIIGFYGILFVELGEICLLFAGLSLVFSGFLDSVDGGIASITDQSSEFGAYLDSVIDKFGDIVWMMCPIYYILKISWFYGGFYTNLFFGLGAIGIAFVLIQEYCRARQQGLGIEETPMTAGERPWRLMIMSYWLGYLGISYMVQYSPACQQGIMKDMHTWIAIWGIPISIIVVLIMSIISIIHLSIFAYKNLDKSE